MADLVSDLNVIWHILNDVAIPAPSHRNGTMTQWAKAMAEAKTKLMAAEKDAIALKERIEKMEGEIALLNAYIQAMPFAEIGGCVIDVETFIVGNANSQAVSDWLVSIGFWASR